MQLENGIEKEIIKRNVTSDINTFEDIVTKNLLSNLDKKQTFINCTFRGITDFMPKWYIFFYT